MRSKTNFGTFYMDLKWCNREYDSGLTDSAYDDVHRIKMYYYMYSWVVKLH